MATLLTELEKRISLLKFNPKYIFYLMVGLFSMLYIFLGIFRDVVADESLYLRESLLIADSIKSFRWFGNLGVGLHGFLFKIPVAILFIFTGPSAYVATFYNIFLAILCILLFYRIVNLIIKNEYWVLGTVFLLLTSFRFASSTPTYLRETPVLLTVLYLIYTVITNKNKWVVGLSFLLMLDAKEHVFYSLVPGYMAYSIVYEASVTKHQRLYTLIKKTILHLYQAFSLSTIYLILMFFTGSIPLNMFNASILGITDQGLSWQMNQFSVQQATDNNIKSSDAKTISLIDLTQATNPIKGFLIKIINTFLLYLGKILYPRTFSFLSVPKIIIIPSLFMSFVMAKKWFRGKNIPLLLLPILYWIYLIIFILRSSHGRYLFPIVPIILIFFVFFLRDGFKNKKLSVIVLFSTLIFVIGGLVFETSYVTEKILLNAFLFSQLTLLFYLTHYRKRTLTYFYVFTIICLGVATISAFAAFSLFRGQLGSVQRFGINRECSKIVSHLNLRDAVWINNIGWGQLFYFYRYNTVIEPEWFWVLPKWVPKKNMLKTVGIPNTFEFGWTNTEEFKQEVYQRGLNKVVLIKSLVPNKVFSYQEKESVLMQQSWLSLKDTLDLKNKKVYIFEVIQ